LQKKKIYLAAYHTSIGFVYNLLKILYTKFYRVVVIKAED